jgi:hypothetical protein
MGNGFHKASVAARGTAGAYMSAFGHVYSDDVSIRLSTADPHCVGPLLARLPDHATGCASAVCTDGLDCA